MAKDRDTEPAEESAPSVDDATAASAADETSSDGRQGAHDDGDALEGVVDGADGESDKELALVGAGKEPNGSSSGGHRRARRAKEQPDDGAAESGPPGKGHATPKQRRAESAPERTTPARFVAESIAELRKVVWPTSTQLRAYFVVVLVFVLFVIAYVSLLDLGFGWVVLKVLG